MASLAMLSAARVASLASGRGGLPSAPEWPWVAAFLVLLAVLGFRMLTAAGLTRVEAAIIACVSPSLVLVDAPLGSLTPAMALAANVTGCLLPVAVSLKVLAERRVPGLEVIALVAVGIASSYFASYVEPGRGVLLQYRVPAIVVGLTAAALFHRRPEWAGAAAFAAGAVGVLVGADLLRLGEIAQGGEGGRVILGGAGLIDGIFLVALLASVLAASAASAIRVLLARKQPTGGVA